MKLDQSNKEFFHAVEFVQNTNKSLYLTGKAGAGKTTFLKYIQESTLKQMVVLAPTGVAAINAGGMTINSFFQLPFSPFVPGDSRLRTKASSDNPDESIYNTFKYKDEKKQLIKQLELLIIDEVSMVRCDTLDVIDRVLKVFRHKPHLPFGGVQVVLIGDAHQLPPVVKRDENEILTQFYDSSFFFSSMAFSELNPVHIELKKIYRQKDQEFIDLLNRVRENQLSSQDLNLLNAKYDPQFNGYTDGYITLTTKRDQAAKINQEHLGQLEGKLFTFNAEQEGNFPSGNMPTDPELQLKEGAQIMFVKNDTGELKEYYNGKIGKVKKLGEETIVVEDDHGQAIEVEQAAWENISYNYNKETKRMEEVLEGSFKQYPIKLAWAITVHKSQGLTFDKVVLDVGNSFLPGQVYVALSRCTSLDGIVLKSKITPFAIKHDEHIKAFSQSISSRETLLNELNDGRADQHYSNARNAFRNRDFDKAFDEFKSGMVLRNELQNDNSKRLFLIEMERLSSGNTGQSNENEQILEDFSGITDLIELYLTADSLVKRGKKEDAINVYSRIIELDTNQIKAYGGRAELHDELKQYVEAVEDLSCAIQIDSGNSELYHERANSLFQIDGRERESLDDYNKAITIDPLDIRAYNNRGRTLKTLGMETEAKNDFDYVIDITTQELNNSRRKGTLYYYRGWAKMKLERYDEAIADFDDALKLDPTYISALSSRKNCKMIINDHQGVIEDCDKLIQLDKWDNNHLKDRASSKEEIEDYEGALDDFNKLIQKQLNETDCEWCYFKRGNTRLKLEDWGGAIDDYNMALHLNSDSSYYNNRGVAKENNADLEGALGDFQKALELDPEKELYQNNVREIKEKLGMTDNLPF